MALRLLSSTNVGWIFTTVRASIFLVFLDHDLHFCDPSDGISAIPSSEAAKLAEQTEGYYGHEGNYIIALDVFHQLHCLVSLTLSLIFLKAYKTHDCFPS